MANNDNALLLSVRDGLNAALTQQAKALPTGFKSEKFAQNAVFMIRDSKSDFSQCKPETIIRTLMKAAILGLDPLRGECYAIPYKQDCTMQISYRGEQKLISQHAVRPIKNLYAEVIRDGDFIEYGTNETGRYITHKPLPLNNADVIGAFARVDYQDGGVDYEVMSKADIESVRTNFSKMPNGDPWKKSYPEMCKKTVLRRLCKHIDIQFETAEMSQAFETESDFDVNKKPEKPVVPNVFEKEEDVVEVEYTEVEEIDTSDLPFA